MDSTPPCLHAAVARPSQVGYHSQTALMTNLSVQPLADRPAGEDGINPEARANLLSLATFAWMSALMKKVRWFAC